jgi:hypothetical protein
MAELPKFTVQNKQKRMAFPEWTQNNEASLNNVWFPDEAHLHLDDVVNKQNMRFGESQNPRVVHEKVDHAPRITVWVAISSHGLLEQIFFEETMNSERYLSMLRNTFVPHILVTGLFLQTEWFMQDGDRSHTANVVLDFLQDTFDWRVILNRLPDRFCMWKNWPPKSSDLSPCDYLLWGFLTEKIFPKMLQAIM